MSWVLALLSDNGAQLRDSSIDRNICDFGVQSYKMCCLSLHLVKLADVLRGVWLQTNNIFQGGKDKFVQATLVLLELFSKVPPKEDDNVIPRIQILNANHRISGKP